MAALEALFRWIHIVAGIMWIGHLYFFNFVNGAFAATLEAETRKKVVPQLMPRALYWFRWGAAWTWVTGVLLLLIAFYHTKAVLDDPFQPWSAAAIIMILVTFLAFVPYDMLWSSGLGKDPRVGAAISYVGVVVIVLLDIHWAHFSYRGYVIHTGALFGTAMAANVWMRIWPLQRRIITAVRDGTPADPTWAPVAGLRSRHNTYMSVPLVWAMINSHNAVPYASSPVYLFVIILVGWGATYLLYKNVPRVKGF
jgi:uncharacterized membrane protein